MAHWDPLDDLTADQRTALEAYGDQLRHFNQRHNLVSRDTVGDLLERHLRHALTLAWKPFPEGAVLVDWGTGGGLPALPLGIRFPDVTLHAVDAVGKKVRAVRAMARRLGVDNVEAHHLRAEAWQQPLHYSVSRATAPLLDLWRWHAPHATPPPAVEPGTESDAWTPGLICLKGGDLRDEIAALTTEYPALEVDTHDLYGLLGRPYFRDKVIVHVYEPAA